MTKWKLEWGGITWGDAKWFKAAPYYIFWWNWLPKEHRYWGRGYMWYDGPHKSFGLWFTNIAWSTPWMSWSDEY